MQIKYKKSTNLQAIPHRFGAWIVVDHIIRVYPVITTYMLSHGWQRQADQNHPEHPSTDIVV